MEDRLTGPEFRESFTQKIFSGYLLNSTKCLNCGHQNFNFEIFLDLPINITSSKLNDLYKTELKDLYEYSVSKIQEEYSQNPPIVAMSKLNLDLIPREDGKVVTELKASSEYMIIDNDENDEIEPDTKGLDYSFEEDRNSSRPVIEYCGDDEGPASTDLSKNSREGFVSDIEKLSKGSSGKKSKIIFPSRNWVR